MRTLLLFSCLVCFGCGPKSPFEYVEASGRIAYEDGSLIPSGGLRLLFSAQDAPPIEGAHPRPGVADVNDKGEFACVTSYKYCDGLVPGRHKVAIQQVKDKEGRLLVPNEFTSIATTPLMVDTKDAPFDIKVPRPNSRRQ